MGKAAALRAGVMLQVDDGTEPVPLAGEMRIGREADCEIQIDDRCVSRYHLVIRVDADGVFVQDLMSTNGSYLNGRRLMKIERLDDGDELRIHNHVFRLTGAPAYRAPTEVVAAPANNALALDAGDQPQHPVSDGMSESIAASRLRSDETPARGEALLVSPVAGIRNGKLSAIERQMARERQNREGA